MKISSAPFAQTLRTLAPVCTQPGTFVDDNPTNTQLLVSAGPEGALVTEISAFPRGTITATNAMLFLSKDGGTTKRLVDMKTVAAWTSSTTSAPAQTMFGYSELAPLRLEANDKLYISIAVSQASGVVFKSEWSDF
jgi:hypothetical protein